MTCTVKELREALTNLPDDLPVTATWEGIITAVDLKRSERGFWESNFHDGKLDMFCLYVDQI